MLDVNEETREMLASAAHETWARWMEYLFQTCQENQDGSVLISPAMVSRWRRQMATPYSHLTETEKRSDQAEADRLISLLAFEQTTN